MLPVMSPLAAAGGLWADPRPELVMTVARSVADVLADHVRLEVECIDRRYLNVYQLRLTPAGATTVRLLHVSTSISSRT